MIDVMPPMYPYMVRAALGHIHTIGDDTEKKEAGWLESGRAVLQRYLARYCDRWSVSNYLSRLWIDSENE
jgi:hypothetical protein